MKNSEHLPRIMEQLEDRILFDAVPDGNFVVPNVEPPLIAHEHLEIDDCLAGQNQHRELIVVDTAVADADQLISEILTSRPDQSFDVRLLSPESAGIDQLSEILSGGQTYRALHILSHGNDGMLQLGSSTLDANSLQANAGQIALWADALTEEADLLLYGCNLASTDSGREFVDTLSNVTGADVAASVDLTGHQELGGDWKLEYQTGLIESTQFSVAHYFNTLNSFTIQTNSAASVSGDGGVGTTGTWSNAGFIDSNSTVDSDGDGDAENDQDVLIDVVATVINVTGTASVDFETVSTTDSLRDDMRARVSGDGTATVRWEIFEAGTINKPDGGVIGLTISDIDGVGGPESVEGVSASLHNLSSYTLQSPTNLEVSVDDDFLVAQGTQNQNDEQPSWVRFNWSTANELVLTYHVYDNGTRFFNHDGDGDLVFTNPDTSFTQGLDLDADDSSGASGSNYQTTYVNGSIPGTNGDVPVSVADADIRIFDLNDTTLTGATIVITNASAGDQLNVNSTLLAALGINANVDTTTAGQIVVNLTGTSLIENYQTAIKSVTYSNSEPFFDQSYVRIVEISATDGINSTGTATTAINFATAINSPSAAPDAYVFHEDGSLNVNIADGLLANDNDPQGDTIYVESATDASGDLFAVGVPHVLPSGAMLTIQADGSFSYVPVAHSSGTEYFHYTINDGNGNTTTAFATINVLPVADQPTITTSYTAATVNEDQWSPVLDIEVFTPDTDGSETLAVIASGFTKGSMLSDGNNTFTANTSTTNVDISDWNLDQIRFRAALNSDTDHNIVFSVTATEPNGDALTANQMVNFVVNAVADGPSVSTLNVSGSVNQPVNLSGHINISLIDNDGSESIDTILIENIPTDAQLLDNGSPLTISNGSVTVSTTQLDQLSFLPPPNGLGTYKLAIFATAIENAAENGVSIGSATTGPVLLNITIDDVDEAVTAHDDVIVVTSGQSITIDVLANDEVPDGSAQVTQIDSQPISVGETVTLLSGEGQVTLNANSTLTFTASPSATGTVQFDYRVADFDGDADFGIILASITPPTINDSTSVDEDATVVIDVLGNDPTAAILPGTITNQLATQGGHGTTTVNADGTVSYTPDENFNGNDTFSYAVTGLSGGMQYHFFDGLGSWRSLDEIPDLDPDFVGIANDFDSAALASSLTGSNSNYGIRYIGKVYIENADNYQFSLQSNNGSRIHVNGNLVADNNNAGGTTSNSGTINLSSGYHDIVVEHYDFGGAASLIARMSGSDTGGASTNLFGTGRVGSAVVTQTATVNVIVAPTNDLPTSIAIPDSTNFDADTIVGLDISNFFSDIDGDTLTFDDAASLPPGLSISSSGIISGTIANNASTFGPFLVSITANDGNGGSTTESFTWIVNNPAPTATDDYFIGDEDNGTTGNVLTDDTGNGVDSDPDSDTLTVFAVEGTVANVGNPIAGSAGGLFTIESNGSVVFDPGNDFTFLAPAESTTTSVNYTTTDGQGGTSSATVTVAVTGRNDIPTTTGMIANQISEDGSKISSLDVSGFFNDVDDTDTLTFNDAGTLPPGLFIDSNTGVIDGTLLSSASSSSPYSVVITATDQQGQSVQQLFEWSVTNPGPTANPDSNFVDEDFTLVVDAPSGLLGNDFDIDGDSITVSQFELLGTTYSVNSTASLSQGDLTINSDGSYQFVAAPDFNGAIPDITYTIQDSDAAIATAVLSLVVVPVNDAPVATTDQFTTDQNTAIAGSVFNDNGSGLDFDVDGDLFSIASVNGLAANIGEAIPGSDGGVFTIDPDGSFYFDPAGDFDYLDSGETAFSKIVYSIEDPSGAVSTATVTAVISGLNDVSANDDNYKVFKDEVLTVPPGGVLANDTDPELSALPGITSAISFSGAGGTSTSLQNLPGNPTKSDASFEIWVRPTDINDHDTLFETGAMGDGLAITLNSTTVNFEARNMNGSNNSIQRISVDLTSLGITDPTEEFIQIVGVIEIGGNLDLYINGQLTASSLATGITDWAGGNGSGLGQNNGGSTIGGTTGFEGEFALFRFYETALSAADVQNNFDSIAIDNGPQPVVGATLLLDPGQDSNSSDAILASSTSTAFSVNLHGSTTATGLKVLEIDGEPTDVGTAITLASGAIVKLNDNGSFEYDPNGSFDNLTGSATATDSFSYTATDSNGATDSAIVTITICHDNDSPTPLPDTETVNEDTSLSGNLLNNDTDPDGDALFVVNYQIGGVAYAADSTAILSEGELTIQSDGSYSFEPTPNYNGLLPVVTYTVSDGSEVSSSTLTIAVAAVNDSPILSIDAAGFVAEDTSVTLTDNGSIAISDPDFGDTHTVSSSYNGDANWSGGVMSTEQIAALTSGTFEANSSGWSYSVPNAATQFIDNSESVTFSFEVTVTDSIGGSDSKSVLFTIFGNEDVTNVSGTSSGIVVEDGNLSASGVLSVTDVDLSDQPLSFTPLSNQIGSNGFGLFSIDVLGNWSYQLDNNHPTVQALDLGESIIDQFAFTVGDANGATESHVVTVTIAGADDAIKILGTTTGSVHEDGNTSASGTLLASDLDTSDNPLAFTPVFDQTGDNGLGTFSIDSAGNWSFQLNNANPDVQALDDGESLFDSIDFVVTNADGETENQNVTILITGNDDAVVITGDVIGNVAEDSVLSAGGKLLASDPDTTDNPLAFNIVSSQIGSNGYGAFSIDAQGNWTYGLDNSAPAVQALDLGETLTDTYDFVAVNADGDYQTRTVTVTITGADDAIVTGGNMSGSVSEDGVLNATGSLTAADADTSDNPMAYSITNNQLGDNGYGHFSIDETGSWTYVLDNHHNSVQALDEAETLEDSYTFSVTNADGDIATQLVTVTISGADDAIIVSGTTTGAVADGVHVIANGTLTAFDVDTSDNPVVFNPVVDVLGDHGYGVFSIDANGEWSFVLDHNHDSVVALDDGESMVETFSFTAVNANGESVDQVVSVLITGADDAIIVGGDSVGGVQEDATILTTGTLSATDVDSSDNPLIFTKVDNQPGDHGYGHFTIDALGNWTYILENNHASVQALDSGEALIDTIEFSVTNGDGDSEKQLVTVTISGSDDVITTGGSTTGTVSEDGAQTATGRLFASDIDTTDNPLSYTIASNQPGDNLFGVFSIDSSGNWIYELNNSNPDVQSLDAGESLFDSYTFTVTNADGDATTQTVIVSIIGADDAIVLGGTTSGSVTEDSLSLSTGKLTASDVDTTDNPVLFIAVTNQHGTNEYGNFSIDVNGNWTYELNSLHPAVQALDDFEFLTDSFEFTAMNADGETQTQSVVITIAGADDAIITGGDLDGDVEEDSKLSTSGKLVAFDVDTSDNPLFYSVVSALPGDNGYGEFSIDNVGNWEFKLNNSHPAVQALDSGEFLNDSFSFMVTNADGDTQAQVVTVTISGADDAIVIGGTDFGNVEEDNLLLASGTLLAEDVDTTDNPLLFDVVLNEIGDSGFGSFSIDERGNWFYALNNHHSEVQALDLSEFLTDSFAFTVSNADGDTDSRTVHIAIAGTDDAIVIDGQDYGEVIEDDSLTTTGSLNATDVDLTDNPMNFTTVANQAGAGGWGQFSIDADGNWSYQLENSHTDIQSLGTGDSLTDSFTFDAINADGDIQSRTVEVTIVGKNDSPAVTLEIANQTSLDSDIIELDIANNFDDVDGDNLKFSATGLPTGLSMNPEGKITGRIDSNASEAGSFNVAVTANDENGGSHSTSFVWHVSNPSPTATNNVIVVGENSTITGNVILDDNGHGSDFDPDGDALVVSAVNGSELNVDQFVDGSNGGSFQVSTNGNYQFDPGTDFDDLAIGESRTTTVSYSIDDGNGGLDSATISVEVKGLNDNPGSNGNIPNQSSNDSDFVASFDVSSFFSDVDATDELIFDDHNTLPPGLTLAPNSGLVSGQINSNASLHGPYSVAITASDQFGGSDTQVFTWEVSNPVPVALNNSTDAIEDNMTAKFGNVITNDSGFGIDDDPDNDLLFVTAIDGQNIGDAATVNGEFGFLTINKDGSYEYALDNNTEKVQQLAKGQREFESFDYTISDGQGGTADATLVVNIFGTNDAPVVTKSMGEQKNPEGQLIEPIQVADFVKEIDHSDRLSFDSGGTLPPGLIIDSSSGEISGEINPGVAEDGPFDVNITVTDEHGSIAVLQFKWVVEAGYRFDAFNDIATDNFEVSKTDTICADESQSSVTKREIVISNRVENLAPEPILAGKAAPGTMLIGRIYAADGTVVGEARDTANSAGNWVMKFQNVEHKGQTRVVIEHVATEEVELGGAQITLSDGSYRSLQPGTSQTESLTAGSILSSTPSTLVGEMGKQNINPLNLL